MVLSSNLFASAWGMGKTNKKRKGGRKMKWRRIRTGVRFMCFLAMVALAFPHAGFGAMVFKLNSPFAPGAPADRAANLYAKNVKDRTNGDITIQIYPAFQLGNVYATYQGLTLGTIDMTVIDSGLAGYIKGHEAFFVGQVPYLFNSLEECQRIYNSEIYAPLYDHLLKDKGIRKLVVAGHKQGLRFG
jgi:TRAP-type C4-dicarboxylate transport system substrate-binding protein